MTDAQHLRAEDRVTTRWRNGGGETTEILSYPSDAGLDDFEWRISVATIDADSPFSSFPGIDRLLVPLTADLDVTVDGDALHLARFEVWAFAGEQAVAAVSVTRSSDDLNLMVRRGTTVGSLEILAIDAGVELTPSPGEQWVVIALDGSLTIDGDHPLALRDAVAFRTRLRAGGNGIAALVRLSPVRWRPQRGSS